MCYFGRPRTGVEGPSEVRNVAPGLGPGTDGETEVWRGIWLARGPLLPQTLSHVEKPACQRDFLFRPGKCHAQIEAWRQISPKGWRGPPKVDIQKGKDI